MTRINLIPVEELTDQHLLAEHREIKRIPNIILSWRFSLDNQPKEFTLWTGHVKFFYDKMLWLTKRYNELHLECVKRWFKVENYIKNFLSVNTDFWINTWRATQRDIEISRQRIQEKINIKPNFYKYYWKPYINI